MKILDEGQDIRRRSSSAAVFLHIPYLNYIFFLAIIRGAYLSMKNFYLFNRRNPSIKETLRLLIRFVFHCSVRSGLIAAFLLFVFAWNPFGEMMGYYWDGIHSLIGGLSLDIAINWFGMGSGETMYNLVQSNREWAVFSVSFSFIFFSYLIFSFIGIILGWVTNTLQEGETLGPV